MKKHIAWSVILSIFLPLFILSPLDNVAKGCTDYFGLIVQNQYHNIIITLVCFCITYYLGVMLLCKGEAGVVLRIIHAILTFLWCINCAMLYYYGL